MDKTIYNKTSNIIKLEGPLGCTVLNIEKHDTSGFFCLYPSTKNIDHLKADTVKNVKGELKVISLLSKKYKKSTFNSKPVCTKSNIITLNNFKGLKCFLEEKEKNQVFFKLFKQKKSSISNLYKQKLQGVSRGYFMYLRLVGVGYRVFFINNTLTFKLGFSHFIKIVVPSSIRVFLPEPTLICIYGLDKNQVTQIGAKVQEIKRPSPYKGKGIRVLDAQIKLKIGKKK